ncbi:MAG TPA: hypothetical protein VGJ59_22175 [Jatrophihabitantaceae bacterium]
MTTSTGCSPRWATERSGLPSRGARVAKVARLLGVGLYDWQRLVVDVALEHENGIPRYRDVTLTVPRQQGKSTLLLCVLVDAMLAGRIHAVYAAQNRLGGRSRLFDEWWPRIAGSPLRSRFQLRRATGAEGLLCTNGSRMTLLSSEISAAHGETLDLVLLDEVWAYADDRLEQACRPATITRPGAQFWVTSTAGHGSSTFLRGKVDAGRLAASTGLGGAYFEWSAADDADPTDAATWYGCMPQLGRTVQEDVIRADLGSMRLSEFRRGYLNQWPDASFEGWRLITEEQWNAVETDESWMP